MYRRRESTSRHSTTDPLSTSGDRSREQKRKATKTLPCETSQPPDIPQEYERAHAHNLPMRPIKHSVTQVKEVLANTKSAQRAAPQMSSSDEAVPSKYQFAQKPTSLGDLPTEILASITSYLDVNSIHNLRLSHRQHMGICNNYLRKHYSVLHLHPTNTSMMRLLGICANDLYAPYITHLVLLGEPMWEDIEKHFEDYRWDTQTPRKVDWLYFGKNGARYKTWPWVYPTSSKTTRSPAAMPSPERVTSRTKGKAKATKSVTKPTKQDGDHGDADFETRYKTLIDALKKLQQLRSLSYMTKAELPGLNSVSDKQVMSHARATIITGQKMSRPGIPVTKRLSDADVFYRLLASPGLNFQFRNLSLRDELPLFDGVRQEVPMHSLSDIKNPFSIAFSELTSLDITIECGWWGFQNRMYARLLRGSRQSLESLRIRFTLSKGDNGPNHVEALECVFLENWTNSIRYSQLRPIELPKLKTLEIIGVDSSSCPNLTPDRFGRWPRPPCLSLGEENFWKQYLGTLTTLRLQHITTMKQSIDPSFHSQVSSIPETIKSNLKCIGQYATHLERFDWIVPALRHDTRRCKAPPGTNTLDVSRCGSRARGHCGIYNYTSDLPSTLGAMYSVAVELGVDLDTETDCWNFGDYLRPKIEKRIEQRKPTTYKRV